MRNVQKYYSPESVEHNPSTEEGFRNIVHAEENGAVIIEVNLSVSFQATTRELLSDPVYGANNVIYRFREQLERNFLTNLSLLYPKFVADARRFWEIYNELWSMVKYNSLNKVEKTSKFDACVARKIFKEGAGIANRYGKSPCFNNALISMFKDVGCLLGES